MAEGFVRKEDFDVFVKNLRIQLSSIGIGIAPASSSGSSGIASHEAIYHHFTSVLEPTFGGTGIADFTAGDVLYASADDVWGLLAKGTTGNYLRGGDAPSWETPTQNEITDLKTSDEPTFAGLNLADTGGDNFLHLAFNQDETYDVDLNILADEISGAYSLILQNAYASEDVSITLDDWFDQGVKTVDSPTFMKVTIGPEEDTDESLLIFKSYFDSPTNTDENTAGYITGEGTGTVASGTSDDPYTRGTEWNLDTAELVSKTGLTQGAHPNGCLGGGLLITENATTGAFEGYSVSTGALVRSSAAHGFSHVRGFCSDGTYFYVTGILTAGNARVVRKYQISDFATVATWVSTWPEFQNPWVVKYNDGFLYTFCLTLRVFFKINVATMAKDSSFAGPQYSPGNYYQLMTFDIDEAGTYIYAVGQPASGAYFIKANLSDGILVSAGTTDINPSVSTISHYSEGGEERFYVTRTTGDKYAGKMNPATLDWYYSTVGVTTAHEVWGIAADANYLYVFTKDNGVDRYLKNNIGGTASTEAGTLRFWVNKLGVITEGANLDDDLNFNVKGAFVSEVAIGTAPVQPTSTTMCPNLNADLLDGNHAVAFEPAITAGTTAQFWRGDKTWQTLNQAETSVMTKRWCKVVANNGAYLASHVALTASGTEGNADDNDSNFISWTCAATDTTEFGFYTTTNNFVRPHQNATYYCKFKTGPAITNLRFFVGFTANNSDWAADPTSGNLILLRYVVGTANFTYCTKDGATLNSVDSGVVVEADTVYVLKIVISADGGYVIFTLNGANAKTVTSNLPAASTPLGFALWGVTQADEAKTLSLSQLYVDGD